MIIIVKPDISPTDTAYQQLLNAVNELPSITVRQHEVLGAQQTLHEIYLIGETANVDVTWLSAFDAVDRVIRISQEYRILGRHKDDTRSLSFTYNGVEFNQDTFHLFAGLCAVDTPKHVEQMMAALQQHGLKCTRMGAYKPRTNPYSFQGHGAECLPYVFELAGKYDIRVIAMEVTHESHVNEIQQALAAAGNPTGVMLQIGTRNTQNFELLKAVGKQKQFPVLLKRGFGISLEESLNAAEYLASEGNTNIIFGLRGMKSAAGDPHRNFVDFAMVPVVKRLTRIPVCIDPSHSVGSRERGPDGILDICQVTAQGIIAGANMVLVDFHPQPSKALVDGPQAMLLDELGNFIEDIEICRRAYQQRIKLYQGQTQQ